MARLRRETACAPTTVRRPGTVRAAGAWSVRVATVTSGRRDPGQSPRDVRSSAPSWPTARNATGADVVTVRGFAGAEVGAAVRDGAGEVGDSVRDGAGDVGDPLWDGEDEGEPAAEGLREAVVSTGGGVATWRNVIATRTTSAAMKSTSPTITHRPVRTRPPPSLRLSPAHPCRTPEAGRYRAKLIIGPSPTREALRCQGGRQLDRGRRDRDRPAEATVGCDGRRPFG